MRSSLQGRGRAGVPFGIEMALLKSQPAHSTEPLFKSTVYPFWSAWPRDSRHTTANLPSSLRRTSSTSAQSLPFALIKKATPSRVCLDTLLSLEGEISGVGPTLPLKEINAHRKSVEKART